MSKRRRRRKNRKTSVGIVLERRNERTGTQTDESEVQELWERYRKLPETFFGESGPAYDLYTTIGLLLAQEDERVLTLLGRAEELITFGRRTGETSGELEEGWNPKTEKYEFKHPREWDRMKELEGPAPEVEESWLDDEEEFPSLPGTKPTPKPKLDPQGRTQMHKIDDRGVHVKNEGWVAAAEARLRIERESTKKMREDLTTNLNSRIGTAKKGLEDNCSMASSLADMLEKNPELLAPGGLFCRIVGGVKGQGQHKVKDKNNPTPEDAKSVSDSIKESARRLKESSGEGEDGNMVLQFIGCFVDGLTEVIEGQKTAQEQFDKVWKLFKLPEDSKEKLLKRVEGFKQLAGASSDTLSGKGAQDDTRKGFMSNDPRKQLSDTNALVKGDVSGSMHPASWPELAESLFGGGKIKEMGDPVLVTDKNLLNSRALDALALTAGGKAGDNDLVFHTAWEMINGMQSISGVPPISQAMATEIMDLMTKGMSFTDAMEQLHKGEKMPWQE